MRSTLLPTIGILLLIYLAGTTACNKHSPTPPPGGGSTAARSHGHFHAHGPNGGHVIELDTADYHAELVQNSQRVGIHLLDANAAEEVALPADAASVAILVTEGDTPTEYQLPAVVQPEDAQAKSSFFEIDSEPLMTILTGSKLTKGPPELKITIDGKTYTGVIENEHTLNPALTHSHSEGPDETLVWKSELDEAGYKISLGHHGVLLLAGSQVEPAVQVTRDGAPVADAQVFSTLLDEDGDVLAEEVATVYEPPAGEEPAHYAQGKLKIPPGTRAAKFRFRIVLPEGKGERTFDVPVTVQ